MESSGPWERSVFEPTEDLGLDSVLERFQRDGVEALPLEDRLRALAAPCTCSEVEDLDPRSPARLRGEGAEIPDGNGVVVLVRPSHRMAERFAGSSQAVASPPICWRPRQDSNLGRTV
jgi:hypothetical protein